MMMFFNSLERGNLYDSENLKKAEETFKKKRDLNLENIIEGGKKAPDDSSREFYRKRLADKIREGLIDMEFLSKYNWPDEKILITRDIVDFLLPLSQKENLVVERKEIPLPEIKRIQGVILPTKEKKALETGSGNGMERRIFPRFEILVNFLDKNGIDAKDYFCYQGENHSDMVRKENYIMFILPMLEKMALLCNEEGNATYVVHISPNEKEFEKLKNDEAMEENERNPKLYYQMSKQELMLLEEIGLTSQIRWNEDNWLEKIETELTKKVDIDFSHLKSNEDWERMLQELKDKKNNVKEKVENGKGENENKERVEILPFEEARKKAREFGFASVIDYKARYNNINGLPSNPNRYYKDNGWKSFADFLNLKIEYRKPEEFLSFDEAREKARNFGFISQEEYKDRYEEVSGLPSHPDEKYEKKGWKNWKDFLGVGIERQKQEDILSFNDAREKAINFGFTSSRDYEKRYKDVPGLPANPDGKYENEGWKGWPDFIGIGKENKKISLSYEMAREKVKKHGFISSTDYLKRYGEVSGLPSRPDATYLNDGWIDWDDFLGKEKMDGLMEKKNNIKEKVENGKDHVITGEVKKQEKKDLRKPNLIPIEAIENNPELAKKLAEILKGETVESEKQIDIPPYYEKTTYAFFKRMAKPKRLDATMKQARSYFINLAEFGKEKAREILEKEKKQKSLTIEAIENDPELAKQLAEILKDEYVLSKKQIDIPPYYEKKMYIFLRRIARQFGITESLAKSYFLNLAEFGKEKAREILEKEKEEFKKKKNNS